jgi:pimeloyl-ACP methyl ester carboxylesterase
LSSGKRRFGFWQSSGSDDLRSGSPARAVFDKLSGLQRIPGSLESTAPLMIAIHGGSYTSRYFDVPGYSLLDRAAAIGIPIIAPDRPGYGKSPLLPSSEGTIKGQANYMTKALHDAWKRHGKGRSGIFLIGHSIGGAIVLTIASAPDGLPLLGVAVSGVGLRTPAEHQPLWNSLPDTPTVDMPGELKDQLMFGPPGSFDAAMPAASHVANAPAPRPELIDIVGTWHNTVHDTLSKITIPVHYRQAEVDHLWIVDQGEVDGFRRALSKSPRVDAAMMRGTGHCMDFHKIGASFQIQQLGFALQCAVEKA